MPTIARGSAPESRRASVAWHDEVRRQERSTVAIAYRADRSRGIGVSVWDGDVTANEVIGYFARLSSDPEWPPGNLDIADVTTLAHLVLPERDLHDLLLEGSDVDETMQRVMVVGETTDGERERETLVSQWGVNVTTCPDLESACARLGVDVNDVRAIVDELRDELARRPSR
jgi:hypothetical protein